MERSRSQLLELTRCGLWGTAPSSSLFVGEVEWFEILRLAKEQTIVGVVSTAIERLEPPQLPKRADMLRLHQTVTLHRRCREYQIEVLGELLKLVKRAGVNRPVLLKGLGVGLNYSDPAMRQGGDIDLYVGVEAYEKVRAFICKELDITPKESLAHHHFCVEFMNTDIEIHKYPTAPKNIAFRRDDFVKWCSSQLEGDQLREVSIGGVDVLLPPYNFDYIYIFYHTWYHFLTGGVGLRQLCDWGRYIHQYNTKFDHRELARLSSLFHLERPISLFSTLLVDYLGLDHTLIPNYRVAPTTLTQTAMDMILSRGNFGIYGADMKRNTKGFAMRKLMGLISTLRDTHYLLRLDPHYALRFYSKNITKRIKLALRHH